MSKSFREYTYWEIEEALEDFCNLEWDRGNLDYSKIEILESILEEKFGERYDTEAENE